MLVFAQVSSMKPSRAPSTPPWCLNHCARRRATLSRFCSAASAVFLEAEPCPMDETPHRAFIHLQPASRQTLLKVPQGEVARSDPLQQPTLIRAGDQVRPMPAHLAGPTLPVSRIRAARAGSPWKHPGSACPRHTGKSRRTGQAGSRGLEGPSNRVSASVLASSPQHPP